MSNAAATPYFRIGRVVRDTGWSETTIKRLEAKGLIEPPPLDTNGQRRYSPVHIERILAGPAAR
jgi:DNA-binding transcriptional MerR regulator